MPFSPLSCYRAWTFFEFILAVIILCILGIIYVPQFLDAPEKARAIRAKQDILMLENAMMLYRIDNQTYPTTEQGLAALIKKPIQPPIPRAWDKKGYLRELPLDPWGHMYQYANPGQHNPSGIDIYTSHNPIIGNWR